MDQELVDKLIGSYSGLHPHSPSSWIIAHDRKGVSSGHLNDICHINMKFLLPYSCQEMLVACPKGDQKSLDYINCLISDPFKQFNEYINLKKSDACYYIHITDLDKFPANALYNFCIATRAPIEFPETVNRWCEIRDLGVSDNLAMLLAGLSLPYDGVELDSDSKLNCVGPPSAGHWWFEMSSDWTTILNGTPINLSKPYKESPASCTPASTIWGKQDAGVTMKYFNHTIRELKEMFNQ